MLSGVRVGLLASGAILMAAGAKGQTATGGAINPPLSPRNAGYSIDVTLEPATRTITASETIAWRNITTKTIDELQFHLYWNAWRNDRSTWLRESRFGANRNLADPRPEDWARIDVTSLRLLGADDQDAPVDLTSKIHFIAPDDGNADDRTVMAVPLPQPSPPDSKLTIEVKWTAHVPRTFARTGAIGNFFFIAQWFPKLGVLQNEGWNCHQFHSSAEFFSDYGTYDVRMTVPRGWTLGATGVERGQSSNSDGTTTHHYYQDDVHDFAWTTSPDYLVRTARFEHPPLPPVDMRLLLQPEHAGQADRHFDATRTTLRYYGEWFGAYPYGHITIVDPAYQSGAGGMEYPTLFTAGSRWRVPANVLTPESVTVHEAGHQFWYGIVGNNEFEDAWLDEGFNTFSEARAIGERYTPNYLALRYFGGFVPHVFKEITLDREVSWDRMDGYRVNAKIDEESTPSYLYYPQLGRSITYNKTALWMNTMERWLGWSSMQRILSTYFGRWQFKHPKPHDFFDVVTEVAGRDLGWFFDQVYRSSNVFDYGIQEFRSTREADRFRTAVVVRRYGEAIFPVDVAVVFENGERITEHWDGRYRWKLYSYDRAQKAVSAEVDPNRVLLLDVDRTNNSRTLAPKGAEAATKWSLKWMVWLQDCLLSWSLFV